jgi:hypothetical protein
VKQRKKIIPSQGKIRLTEAIDRLIELYTATNIADEVKKWQAERVNYPQKNAPKPPEKKCAMAFSVAVNLPHLRHDCSKARTATKKSRLGSWNPQSRRSLVHPASGQSPGPNNIGRRYVRPTERTCHSENSSRPRPDLQFELISSS